jgi:uncharacterized protein YacL (UPF0231 family)
MKRTFKIALVGTLTGTLLFNVMNYINLHKREKSEQRQEEITETLRVLEGSVGIRNVEEGLEAIRREPTEAGFYLKTAELLERENNYREARSVLESGLEHFEEIPLAICARLQEYNNRLGQENRQYSGCPKIIPIK